jgi:tetratricopeptide (TPR) repeat protein
MDAARAYANAADEVAARRLLARIAADPLASGGVATAATTTLLGVLIAESRPAEAESLFVTLRESLSLDDREREQRRLAMAWARSGNLERAEAMLEGDSTVAGFDVRGRLRAFAGDLALATTWLRLAGPYDDDRESAVARVRLLALLQAVEADSLPALGAALLDLERADTGRAIAAFESIAATIKPPGAAALRLLAGELARDQGDLARAARLLAEADASEAPATAPSARLALAELHIAAGRRKEAAALLEQLILDYPESAVLPEARRARDLLMRIPLGAT